MSKTLWETTDWWGPYAVIRTFISIWRFGRTGVLRLDCNVLHRVHSQQDRNGYKKKKKKKQTLNQETMTLVKVRYWETKVIWKAGPPRSIGKQMKTRSLTHMAMGVQDFVHRRGAWMATNWPIRMEKFTITYETWSQLNKLMVDGLAKSWIRMREYLDRR
jgi:hypothetical protein